VASSRGPPRLCFIEQVRSREFSGDARITSDVYALLAEHREFGAPGAVRVQTNNGVVYLNGLVDTDFERRSIESLVTQVPNVKDVVNSVDVRNTGR